MFDNVRKLLRECFKEIMSETEDLAYLDTICLAAVPDKRYLGIDPN